jgi:carbon-monoxide dehydrogenase medium subunit
MYPPSFDYFAPADVAGAIDKLHAYGDEATVLAGGQSLIPLMKLRLSAPAVLIDLGRLPDLMGIDHQDDDVLVIRALTTERQLERSEIIRDRAPLIAEASALIADPLVRNRGTIGGNIAHADPANDLPAVMLALGAEVVARGPGGERVIPIDDFFQDLFATALASDEIITAVRIPTTSRSDGYAYVKNERQVGDFAVAAAAAVIRVERGQIIEARVGLTNAGATPMRAPSVEAYLRGRVLADTDPSEAAVQVLQDVTPWASVRGSVRYRRAMFENVVEVAIKRAVARASGGTR